MSSDDTSSKEDAKEETGLVGEKHTTKRFWRHPENLKPRTLAEALEVMSDALVPRRAYRRVDLERIGSDIVELLLDEMERRLRGIRPDPKITDPYRPDYYNVHGTNANGHERKYRSESPMQRERRPATPEERAQHRRDYGSRARSEAPKWEFAEEQQEESGEQ